MTPAEALAQRTSERSLTRRLATAGGVVAWAGAVLPALASYHRSEVPLPWWILALVTLAAFVAVSERGRDRLGLTPARVVIAIGVASALGACALWGTDMTAPVLLVLMSGASAWVLSRRATIALVVGLSIALALLLELRSTSAVWTMIYSALMAFAGLMIHIVISEGQAVDEANRISVELGRTNGRLRIANAELEAAHARLAEASRAEERMRISRDLHDGMGNQLTALSLTLEILGRQVNGEAAEHVAEAKQLATGLLRDARAIITQLRDGKVSVRDEIARMARSLPRPHTSLDLAASIDGVSAPVADTLVRIVQESLTNVARHSSAEQAWVVIGRDDTGVSFEIRDNGPGGGAVVPGNGLSGMTERVAMLGGELTVWSAPGDGVHVRGHIPEEPPAPEETPAPR